ncbi:hypothetical protein [uncultured Roseobacter sp.]|uniref:hypothetical protein n=1 Tax=uncultured Roseobacter sp. TaxID=114847 RepID=UPI002608817A|nr:hypothetical protein [uncultured Roseobacter sp.]
MFRILGLLTAMILGGMAEAHEYWLEPSAFLLEPDEELSVTVRVGEALEGRTFPFDPRAYKAVIWAGARDQVDLSAQQVRAKVSELQPFGNGLHSLTVSSYDQTLTYKNRNDLLSFLKSVGQEALIEELSDQDLPATSITEMYRRSSKLLVHFGTLDGEDSRRSLSREWVAMGNGFVLFDQDGVAANQSVQILCRSQETGAVSMSLTMKTHAAGQVSPRLPERSVCLLNSVFVEPGGAKSDLKSDWVSLHFKTFP